ncbi:MAG: sugar phosphate isomerase/epimerase [Candidatus Hydrogenedentes bacterium]|nr:sugar phosphate isomerase/epimerase [Candidatus Hydrogenedentota bacterium]
MPFGRILFAALVSVTAMNAAAQHEAPRSVYMGLTNPAEHPDFARRHVQPPTYATFGNHTEFVALRGFPIENNRLVRYAEELDSYTKTYDLGNVIWPHYTMIFAENVPELAEEIKRRGLFLFDLWGYVPGSGPGDWQQFVPPAAALNTLETTLGDHWLGMDIGEQDGRYIGGYADQAYPISADRLEQYYHFQRHFERMGNDLGNRLSTLVSLNFGHYFLKEGLYTLIGAETAQGLPNSQVYYSFIRGAGKQYGVLWFGNASVWNRWGYKNYDSEGQDHGPTRGTSLNLLKRLIYSHILYNSAFVGFESGWIGKDGLTPIGKIQQSAKDWIDAYGDAGVMQTPIALLMDFNCGWSFPRHLYTANVYRVWGTIPYAPGDYLTDNVLDMLYPGYQDSSYYHNETGFMTPTPYGDSADCLLSDVEGWLLNRYPAVVLAGEVSGGNELRDKLVAYVEQGGHLIVTAGNVAKWSDGIAGIVAEGTPKTYQSGQAVDVNGTAVSEENEFALIPLTLPASAVALARCGDVVAAARVPYGKGKITVVASPFGVPEASAVSGEIANPIDQPLLKPFPMLRHVRAVVDSAFREHVLFDAGPDVSLIVCRKAAGDYTLGICNNVLEERPFTITSHCGAIQSIEEQPLDQSEKGAPGYLPFGSEGTTLGASGEATVAGGDVRIFRVRVAESNVAEISHVTPASRARGRILPMSGARTIKEFILACPTFFEHADGVIVDWRYLHERDANAIAAEAGWIKRQGLRVIADLTSGVNLYPDLRLVNNVPADYTASREAIDDIIAKMGVLGATDLVIALHRVPENNITSEDTRAGFVTALREICEEARNKGITVNLRMTPNGANSKDYAMAMLKDVNAQNLRIAASIAMLHKQGKKPADIGEEFGGVVGLWLASAPKADVASKVWTYQAPLSSTPDIDVKGWKALAPDAPVVLDSVYADWDAAYSDVKALEAKLSP